MRAHRFGMSIVQRPEIAGEQIAYCRSPSRPILQVVPYQYHFSMPPKIRELEKTLLSAGYRQGRGKGSHRKYTHPEGPIVVISGKAGADARDDQVRQVRNALRELKR